MVSSADLSMNVLRLLGQRSYLQSYLDFADKNNLSLAIHVPLQFSLRELGQSTSLLPRGLLHDPSIELMSAVSCSQGVMVQIRLRRTGCIRQVRFECGLCKRNQLCLRNGTRVRIDRESHWARGQFGVAEAQGETGHWRVRLDQGRNLEFMPASCLQVVSMRVCHHFSGAQLDFFNGKRRTRDAASLESSEVLPEPQNSEIEQSTALPTKLLADDNDDNENLWLVAPVAHESTPEDWTQTERADETLIPGGTHRQSFQDCVAEMNEEDVGDMMDLLGSLQPEL